MIATLVDLTHRRPARRLTVAWGALLAVAAVVVLVLLAERAPSPVPAVAPQQEFSAQRALGPLQEFATEPRPLGSAASDRARAYLADTLRAAGFSVHITRAVGAYTAQGVASFGRVENIVATLPGRDPTGSVVLAAHYDSVAAGPGASDDAAAIAAMLETVRALREGDQLRNDLVLLLTDGEEAGLFGADAFARNHPLVRDRAVVLNWEARGVSGPSLMFETSRNNAALVELFATAAPHPHGDSSLVEIYRLLPNDTDFTKLAEAGLPGMNFAYVEGAARYHTPGDTIANLDPASLQHHGANMLALTRALGNTDLATLAADHDAVYFRVLGPAIAYPVALVWPLALLAVLMLFALVVFARRRRLLSVSRLFGGVVSVALVLATAALLAQGLWWVLLTLRPDYADNPFLYRPQLYQGAVAALAALAVVVWYLVLRRAVGPAALACAGLVWLAALGALTAWLAPGASHLFALPALGGAVGALLALLVRRYPTWSVVALLVGVVPAIVLLMPLGVGTFDAAGLAQGGVAAALLALFGFTLLPLVELFLPPLGQRLGAARAALVPTTGLLLVLVLIGVGLAVDPADPAHPRRSNLVYLLDADTGRAHWVSQDAEPGPWTRRYVSNRAELPAELPFDLADRPVWTGPAPVIRAPAPEVTLRSRQGHTVTLHVSSPRSASAVLLSFNQRIGEATVTAPGLAPVTLTMDGAQQDGWPTEVRFADLPAEGIDVTLRASGQGPLRIAAHDQTRGLATVPGFLSRPPGVERSAHDHGDVILVQRTYEF